MKTAQVAPNLLNREFESRGPRAVLLTDITYITGDKAPRCYLSTIIDACTKELLAWFYLRIVRFVGLFLSFFGAGVEILHCVQDDIAIDFIAASISGVILSEAKNLVLFRRGGD